MPQYSSFFRNNVRYEKISDDTFTREISFSVSDYGTISPTDYEANGDLFKKAYDDIINRIYGPNVRITLNVPAGDYYFRGSADANQYLILDAPQGGLIKIVGASTVGTRPLSTTLASQTKAQNYTTLASHYATRFHFSYNGFFCKFKPGGTYSVGGFSNIAFFGTWNGSPGNQLATGTVDSRGITGNLRLEYCAIHGFNGPSANSTGIIATDSSAVSIYSLIVSNCGRGIHAYSSGNLAGFSANTDADRDIIVNCSDHSLLAMENSSIRLGDGAHIRNSGGYGAYAFDCSSITVRSASFSGNALGASSVYPGTNSIIHTTTVY